MGQLTTNLEIKITKLSSSNGFQNHSFIGLLIPILKLNNYIVFLPSSITYLPFQY